MCVATTAKLVSFSPMYKIAFFLLFLLTPCSIALGQGKNVVDSLLAALQTQSSVKNKANAYRGVMNYYKNKDLSKALKYADTLQPLVHEVSDAKIKAELLGSLAAVYLQEGASNHARQLYEQSIEEYKSINDLQGEALVLSELGAVCGMQDNYKQALAYFFEALSLQKELDDKSFLGTLYNDIGTVYLAQDNFDKALEYFLQSVEIKKQLGEKRRLANSYNNLGVIYENKKEYEQAQAYYEKSLHIVQELGDLFGQAQTHNNLAMFYKALGDNEKALKSALKSVELAKKLGSRGLLSYPILTVGEVYVAQKNWKAAKKYLTQGLQLAEEPQNKENIKHATKELATVEAALGNYKKAYEYHMRFKRVYDSLRNETQTEKITRLEMNYEFQQERDSLQFANQQERVLLEKDIEKQKIIQRATAAGVVMLTVLLALLVLYARNKRKSNALLRLKSEELLARNHEVLMQNEEIKIQTEKINQLNAELEKRLGDSLEKVMHKNKKLLEYAHYNSHETRAPIARLLGLVQVISFEEVDEETAFLLKHIELSAKELDEITRKMTQTLDEAEYYD